MGIHLPYFFLTIPNFFLLVIFLRWLLKFILGRLNMIIEGLILGGCIYKLIRSINKIKQDPKVIRTNRTTTVVTYNKVAEDSRLSILSKAIKANQKLYEDNMGPEGSLDPAAEIWARKVKESFKNNWENDPVVIETQKIMREKYQQRKDNLWADN